jgi:small subunit ribosomal protein S8
MNDIIADSITRVRNAYMRKKDRTTLLYSKVVESSLEILKDRKFIQDYKVAEKDKKKYLYVTLKYEKGFPAITEITRMSKPGRRLYKPAKDLKSFKNGYGIYVISSNKGIVSNKKATELNVGGELLFSVW